MDPSVFCVVVFTHEAGTVLLELACVVHLLFKAGVPYPSLPREAEVHGKLSVCWLKLVLTHSLFLSNIPEKKKSNPWLSSNFLFCCLHSLLLNVRYFQI